MKNIHFFLRKIGFAALTALFAVPVSAQNILPEGTSAVILAPAQQTFSYRERTLCYDIKANVPFEVTSDASWATVRRGDDGAVYIHLAQNITDGARVANISFANAEQKLTETLTLTQGKDESVEFMPTDEYVKPSSANANNNQSGNDISKTYDGNTNTIYHTSYSGSAFVVSATNPAILTYNFTGVERIDFVTYVPRQDGTSNGNFGEVEILVKKQGETSYTSVGTYNWLMTGDSKTVQFEDGLLNPASIQFKVYSGSGNFASCAEMQFGITNPEKEGIFDVFADDLYTELAPGVTEDDVEAIENPFVKSLAMNLLSGNYDKNYRVATYNCFLNPTVLSEIWNAPGKTYSLFEGATGINFTKGKTAVVVRDLPEGESATLKIVAWYVGKDGGNFDGGNPNILTYPLSNGVNVIDYNYDYDGLGYICYYTQESPEKKAPIRVHIINGQINGILALDKTNEEMQELCRTAKNTCMDIVGHRVQSVWTSDGLYRYCKASDGTSLGYRQFMNMLDSLIVWEHDLLGFTKYNLVPTNHTFAYTNYTYYMFQGGNGVSFHHDCEPRILNCRTLMYNDDDAIWGLSHEWGHQHQMKPYFCWAGMSEVTNNMNSYYNIMHMGYYRSDKINEWAPARRHFLQDYEFSTGKKVSEHRRKAYLIADNYSYAPELRALCLAMADSTIHPYAEDPTRAVQISEVGVGETLCPFIMLYNYATMEMGLKDFAPDMYEALRRTDDENGSQVEKQGAVDKYELIASAQNGNKNGKLAELRRSYPTSCWVKGNYITERNCDTWSNSAPYIMNYIRKVSRLTGYNLFPYFERWGFLRVAALSIGDYGDHQVLITQPMYDEFKEDMDALVESGELKVMPEGMLEAISNMRDINIAGDMKFTTPDIPN